MVAIGDAIDPEVKQRLQVMMVAQTLEQAVEAVEAVKAFAKQLVISLKPVITAVTRFANLINAIFQPDRRAIEQWETEGGGLGLVG